MKDTEFKVGDKIRITNGIYFTEESVVLTVERVSKDFVWVRSQENTSVVKKCWHKHPLLCNCSHLVELANQMPTLEAGMVVEYRKGDRAVYVKKALLIGKTRDYSNSLLNYKHNKEYDIVAVYKYAGFNGINNLDNLKEPIWQRTPEKTAQQIKDEETLKQIAELEVKVAKLKQTVTNKED